MSQFLFYLERLIVKKLTELATIHYCRTISTEMSGLPKNLTWKSSMIQKASKVFWNLVRPHLLFSKLCTNSCMLQKLFEVFQSIMRTSLQGGWSSWDFALQNWKPGLSVGLQAALLSSSTGTEVEAWEKWWLLRLQKSLGFYISPNTAPTKECCCAGWPEGRDGGESVVGGELKHPCCCKWGAAKHPNFDNVMNGYIFGDEV